MSEESFEPFCLTPEDLIALTATGDFGVPDVISGGISEEEIQREESIEEDLFNILPAYDCNSGRLSPGLSDFDFDLSSPCNNIPEGRAVSTAGTLAISPVPPSSSQGRSSTASLMIQYPTSALSTSPTAEHSSLLSQQVRMSLRGVPLRLAYLNLPEVPLSTVGSITSPYSLRVLSQIAQVALLSIFQGEKMLKLPLNGLRSILGFQKAKYRKPLKYEFKSVKGKDGRQYDVRLLTKSEQEGIEEWETWQEYKPMAGDTHEMTCWEELNPVSREQITIRKPGRAQGVWLAHFNTNEEKCWSMIASNAQEAANVICGSTDSMRNKAHKNIRNHLCKHRNPANLWKRVHDSYHVKRVDQELWQAHGRRSWQVFQPEVDDRPDEGEFSNDEGVLSHIQYFKSGGTSQTPTSRGVEDSWEKKLDGVFMSGQWAGEDIPK